MTQAPTNEPHDRPRTGRRRIAIGFGAACVALGLVLAWRAWNGPESSVATAAPFEAAAATTPQVASAPKAVAAGEELPEPIQRFLEANQYPPTSGLLGLEHEDLLQPNRRFERPRPIPETLSHDPSQVVSVLFTSDHYFYTGDDTVEAVLQAWRGDQPIQLRILDARATAEDREGETEVTFSFGLAWQGDGYGARIPLSRFSEHHGPIGLKVRFEYEPGRAHEEVLRLFNTPSARVPARLTGQLRDSVHNGNLRLDVGIEVDQPGFYRFDANLLDAEGNPLAFAIFKGELDRGDRYVPLEIFGKVLHDRGVAGPYLVSHVRGYRFLDSHYPDRERLPDSALVWTTRPYLLAEFSGAPFTSPHQERMVELMLEDVANGISLDVPDLPVAGAAIGPRPPDDDAEVELPLVETDR